MVKNNQLAGMNTLPSFYLRLEKKFPLESHLVFFNLSELILRLMRNFPFSAA